MVPDDNTSQHSGHHGDREDLTGEHRFGDAGQFGFAVIFVAVYVADTFFLRWTTFLNESIPLWIRLVVGIGFLLTAAYLARTSLRIVFGEVRDPPVVIRTGLYGWIRHPMYFSEVLLYAGLICLSLSLAATAVWVLGMVFLTFLCRYEESMLIERFGDDYRQYMREVPMWLPRPWKHASKAGQ